MSDTAFDKQQRELPKLADRLGFANAVIAELRRENSALKVKGGQDASYIAELEHKITQMERAHDATREELRIIIEDPLRGQKLKTLAGLKLVGEVKAYRERLKKQALQLKVDRNNMTALVTRLVRERVSDRSEEPGGASPRTRNEERGGVITETPQ